MRRIFMSYLTAPVADPFEALGIAARAGYDGLGLRLCDPMTGGASSALVGNAAMCRDFAAALADQGLECREWEARILRRPQKDAGAAGRQIAPQVFEAAALLGAPDLIAVPDQAGEIGFAELQDRFAALCDEAAEFGIRVGLEPIAHRACGSLAEAKAIVAAGRNAVLVLDALHLHRMGVSPADLALTDPALIPIFHLCDAPPIPPDLAGHIDHSAFNRLLPGEGILPLSDYLAALAPDVPLSLEIPMQRLEQLVSPEERARRALAAARQMIIKTDEV